MKNINNPKIKLNLRRDIQFLNIGHGFSFGSSNQKQNQGDGPHINTSSKKISPKSLVPRIKN